MIEVDKINTHPSVFCDYRFRSIFKLINRLLSSNIDFIDLSISFPIIDFDGFVTPCVIATASFIVARISPAARTVLICLIKAVYPVKAKLQSLVQSFH